MHSERTRLTVCLGVSLLAHAFVIFGLIMRPPSALNVGPRAFVAQLESITAQPAEPQASAPPLEPESPEPESPDPAPAPETQAPAAGTAAASDGGTRPGPDGAGGSEHESSALPEIESEAAIDDTWYPARQLDVLPVAQVEVEPRYPEAAAALSVGGEVTLLLLVDELGEVHERSVVEANPPGVFDEAALAAFQRVFFQPAMKDGRRVRSRVLVTLTFNPESIEPADTLSAPPDPQ